MGKKERVPNAAHFYTGFSFHRNLMWPNKHKVVSNISKVLKINKERSLPRRTILRNNPLYSPLVLEMVLYVHSPNYDICQCPAYTMDSHWPDGIRFNDHVTWTTYKSNVSIFQFYKHSTFFSRVYFFNNVIMVKF